jgi:hypothetical protein
MQNDYAEAIVTLHRNSAMAKVQSWFEQRGLITNKMQAALVVSGALSLFRNTFGIEFEVTDISDRDMPIPVPAPLADSVASIVVRRLPSLHS